MYCICTLNYVQVSGVVLSIFIPIAIDCDVNKAWSSMLINQSFVSYYAQNLDFVLLKFGNKKSLWIMHKICNPLRLRP